MPPSLPTTHTVTPFSYSKIEDGRASTCNAGDLGSILAQEERLEDGIATHSSILPGETPWTEEPGRRQLMGSHRIGHD